MKVRYRFLFPAILMFCCIGVNATNNSSDQLVVLAVSALFGYLLVLLGCEPAPMVLGFLLGPLMEENLRRSLVISGGDPMIFLQRPISATLLMMVAIAIVLIVVPTFRKTREVAFAED